MLHTNANRKIATPVGVGPQGVQVDICLCHYECARTAIFCTLWPLKTISDLIRPFINPNAAAAGFILYMLGLDVHERWEVENGAARLWDCHVGVESHSFTAYIIKELLRRHIVDSQYGLYNGPWCPGQYTNLPILWSTKCINNYDGLALLLSDGHRFRLLRGAATGCTDIAI